MELLQNKDIRALLESLMGTNGSTKLLDDIREIYNQQEKGNVLNSYPALNLYTVEFH